MKSVDAKYGISPRSFNLIINTLDNENQVLMAILYGSRAMGNAKKGFDIDIAIKTSSATHELTNRISTILNQQLPIPYQIDVQNYDAIENEALKKHIDIHGKIIYKRDK